MADVNERGGGQKGGPMRSGGTTTEEQEWHNKPLQERLQILRSRQGVPSFIDPATIDDRIKWLQEEIQTPGGLNARPKPENRGRGQEDRPAGRSPEAGGGRGRGEQATRGQAGRAGGGEERSRGGTGRGEGQA